MLLFVTSKNMLYAQDATFSQFYSSYLYLNPAFAGSEPSLTLGLNSRTQWKSVTEPYQTNQVSIIAPLYRKVDKQNHFAGIGGSVYQDKAGQGKLKATGVNLNLSYVLRLSETNKILFGLQGGYVQKTLDHSSLQWGSQYDRFNGFNSSLDAGEQANLQDKKSYMDIGAGVLYYNKPGRDIREVGYSFFVGLASYHMNQPNESLVAGSSSKLPMLNKFHGGIEYSISPKFNLSPNVYFAQQSNVNQVNLGMYVNYGFGNPDSKLVPSELILGAWYRLRDAYIFSIGLACDSYSLGFSYDINNSSLRSASNGKGAYEISLRLTKPRVVKTKRVYNPRI